MIDPERDSRYEAETRRMLGVLNALVKKKSPSVRFLEKKMRVADALFNKILKGKITLQFRHILMIADAVDVPWQEIFGAAYGFVPSAIQPIPPELRSMVITVLLELGAIDSEKLRLLQGERAAAAGSAASESLGDDAEGQP